MIQLLNKTMAVASVLAASALCTGLVHAYPGTSPSARAAVRLAYHPPKNYIQHYLPADRYKVAGGTWKVLSTEIDEDYHRATCPNMLRESAGIVLGFASATDAVDAGYRPCPICRPQIPVAVYASTAPAPAPAYTNDGQASAESREASRIVNILADLIAATNKRGDLLQIRLAVDSLQNGTLDKVTRAVLKGQQFRIESLSSVVGALEQLKRAIDAKMFPSPAGMVMWPIHLNNARLDAHPTTPQSRARSQQRIDNAVSRNTKAMAWRGMGRRTGR